MKNIGNGKGPNVVHRRKDVGVDDQFLPSVCEGGKSGQKSDEQHDRRVSDVERWARGLTDSQYTSFPTNVLSKVGLYRSKIGNQPEWNDIRQFPGNSATRHRYNRTDSQDVDVIVCYGWNTSSQTGLLTGAGSRTVSRALLPSCGGKVVTERL